MREDFRRYWVPVFIWGAVIFTLSSFSTFPKAVEPIFSFDGVAHAVEYAIFSFLLARAFKNSKKDKIRNCFRLLAVVCAIVYGVTDEFHQSFIPLRTPSVVDLIFDALGGIIGQMFYRGKLK